MLMSPREEIPAIVAANAPECERIANTRPSGRRNPVPGGVYALAIIGAGPAGIAAAEMAAALGVRVALIERTAMGGVNLNSGSVPSKALIRTSRIYADMRDAPHYGANAPAEVNVDFAAAMRRVRHVRARLSRDVTARRLAAAGVDVYFGDARFVSGNALTVDGLTLRFKKALIATGARPHIPNIPGLAQAGYLTDDNLFELTELPRRLLVIGGGPLGCELAQALCRLGAETSIVQDKPLFLGEEERDAAQILSEAFVRDGIEVRLNTTAVAVRMASGAKLVDLVSDDFRDTIAVDAILTGAGRTPNVEDLNLAVVGVDCHAGVRIRVDDFMRTENPNIYAAGDVCLQNSFVDAAMASAHIAVQNALLRRNRRWSAVIVPSCTYTDPEIARVGLSVRQANRLDIPVKTITIPMHENDRAITDGETAGFVKVHLRGRTDRILGATIVARHAGDMINEITTAMAAGIGMRKLSRVLHAYPTKAAAIRLAADAYIRTHLTPHLRSRLLRQIES
jgi:pyruvate/2-oxoglutarate dehydrogenase complex dihydrolipoamide dehydrogenase (E3) component